MATPHVYVATHSISLPGPEVGGGAKLKWCACFDDEIGGAGDVSVSYSVARVTAFSVAGVPSLGTPLVSGTVWIPKKQPAAYNRDEVGYRWREIKTTIPGNVGGQSGLCRLLISYVDKSAPHVTYTSYAYFLLRIARTGATRALICYPFSTMAAYSGGTTTGDTAEMHLNLYSSIGAQRSRRVTLDRPFKNFAHGGDKEPLCIHLPFRMHSFIIDAAGAGKNANSVDVCTSFDLHSDPNILEGVTLFISVGHDEYWSTEMRDKVQAFVAAGNNAAFFSANTAWWKIRFENGDRTIVGYKSVVEDPLSGADESLTGHFGDVPGAGLAGASHANREENTLTGVSYRRGQAFSAFGAGYTVLNGAPDEDQFIDYFAGCDEDVVDGTKPFGAGVLDFENDGAEYDLVEGLPVLTGRDGTPGNFVIQAALDTRNTTNGGQRGVATMGYYTNLGTVFTAGTVLWADFLGEGGDETVRQITRNVIDDLYDTHERAAWTLPDRIYPTADWDEVESIQYAVSGLTALAQGQLFFQADGLRFARDAENPGSPLATPTIPQLDNARCFGTDLNGYQLLGCTSDGKLHSLPNGIYYDGTMNWKADVLKGPNATPVGVFGFNGNPIVAMRDADTTTLYRVFRVRNDWHKLGCIYPPIRGLTGFDGMLFAVRDAGRPDGEDRNRTASPDLLCRLASNVDLTWTKIGTAPPGTYALAAYYGRLYALAADAVTENVALFWRSAVPDPAFPLRAPSMLFLNDANFAIGRLLANGDFETTGGGELDFSYTHAARVNNGFVFFYNQRDQSGVVVRFEAGGAYTKVKEYAAWAFDLWHLVVYARCSGGRDWADYSDLSSIRERVLFYRNSGVVSVGYFDEGGVYQQEWGSAGFGTNWSHIVTTHAGRILFYKRSNGTCAWGALADSDGHFSQDGVSTIGDGMEQIVPAGNTYLFFYESSGGAALLRMDAGTLVGVRTFTLNSGRKISSCENGVVLDYYYAAGSAQVYGFSADPAATIGPYGEDGSNTFHGVTLRDYPAGSFNINWESIVGLGILPFDPATLTLSGWWRASYFGSPWVAVGSAGTSGTNGDLIAATDPPAVGDTQNGYAPADFDGTDSQLTNSTDMATLFTAETGTIVCVFLANTATAPANGYDEAALFEDTGGFVNLSYTTSGVGAYLAGSGVVPRKAADTGAYHLAMMTWDGTNDIELIVDSNSPVTASGAPMNVTTGTAQVGFSPYGPRFDGRILELMTAATKLTASDYSNIKTYINARYGFSL